MRKEKEDEIIDENETLKDIILSGETSYMTIDKRTGGFIARVFNSNQTRPGARLKHDMIAISYKASSEEGGQIKVETRVIIEVVNDYTFVLDRPFDNKELPEHIFDFKFIVVEGARGSTTTKP